MRKINTDFSIPFAFIFEKNKRGNYKISLWSEKDIFLQMENVKIETQKRIEELKPTYKGEIVIIPLALFFFAPSKYFKITPLGIEEYKELIKKSVKWDMDKWMVNLKSLARDKTKPLLQEDFRNGFFEYEFEFVPEKSRCNAVALFNQGDIKGIIAKKENNYIIGLNYKNEIFPTFCIEVKDRKVFPIAIGKGLFKILQW